MCYKSPGVRCHTHAKSRAAKIQVKARRAFREYSNIDKVYTAKINKDHNFDETKEGKALVKKKQLAYEKMRTLSTLSDKAQQEIDFTKGGIAELKQQIAQIDVNSTDNTIHKAHLQNRLAIAQASYRKSMDAYDVKNGTIDGRAPSNYGTPEGEQLLQKKAHAIAKKTSITKDPQKLALYREKADAITAQIEHSQMTQKAVSDGRIMEVHASLAIHKLNKQKYTKEYEKYRAFEKQLADDNKNGSGRPWQEVKAWRSSDGKTSDEVLDAKRIAENGIYFNKIPKEQIIKSNESNSKIGLDYGNGPGNWTGD